MEQSVTGRSGTRWRMLRLERESDDDGRAASASWATGTWSVPGGTRTHTVTAACVSLSSQSHLSLPALRRGAPPCSVGVLMAAPGLAEHVAQQAGADLLVGDLDAVRRLARELHRLLQLH